LIAVTEPVVVALIAAAATILAAITGLAGVVVATSRRVRNDLVTGNGHTIGAGVARLEDVAHEHSDRLDRIEVVVREHLVAHAEEEGKGWSS
jgi:hypothetical protein